MFTLMKIWLVLIHNCDKCMGIEDYTSTCIFLIGLHRPIYMVFFLFISLYQLVDNCLTIHVVIDNLPYESFFQKKVSIHMYMVK
jgi:hypothetical protein